MLLRIRTADLLDQVELIPAQFLFASDRMTFVQENPDDLLSKPLPLPMSGGALAQVIGTGPPVRYSAMPEMFESLMFAARRELIVTTPYVRSRSVKSRSGPAMVTILA